MTNTKQIQAIVTFLASIAVLDNFIFIESEADAENTAHVEHNNFQADQINNYVKSKAYWVDQENVSTAVVPAVLLESSYNKPQTSTPNNKVVLEN